MLKTIRKWHKWPGIILTFFILVFALSGVILNHRELLSSVDIKRSWLPGNYAYHNWNLGAVKGALELDPDHILVYGNIGIWLTDSSFTRYKDFNHGFPKGIDNRKISSLVKTADGRLFAGTLFGLYHFEQDSWKPLPLPVKEKRIVRILEKGDSLLVMTRSNLLMADLSGKVISFRLIHVPPPSDDDHKTGLFKTLWVIHSGEVYGFIGKLIVDFIGMVFIIICITGLIWFFVPLMLKKVRTNAKSRIRTFNRNSLHVHNWLGSWLLPVLILTTLTGMFLRPPLLIPIANSKVGKIRFSELDSPNPWFDRFRDLLYDQEKHIFYFATNDGIYFSPDALQQPLLPFSIQPPVSVMGITVFEKRQDGSLLIGSFSGIFLWHPETGEVYDHFTGLRYEDSGQSGPPFGNISVSGCLRIKSYEYIFDYAAGAIGLGESPPFVPMPEIVMKNSPISLWNTALEIHTGRIYEPVLGEFYILVVPLVGIFTLVVLVFGFLSWWIARKRKKRTLLIKDLEEDD